MQISEETFFQIRGLSVTYSPAKGDDLRALDGIRLEIRRSEILGILGESGCGKSTLAHAILGLLPAHARIVAGEVFWHGRDLLRFSESELRTIRGQEISWVSQQPALSLNPVMCVGNQVGEVLRAHVPSTVYETYLTHRISDHFVFKADYIRYNYTWSGSGWHIGAPQRLDSTPILGFPGYDTANMFTLGLTAEF